MIDLSFFFFKFNFEIVENNNLDGREHRDGKKSRLRDGRKDKNRESRSRLNHREKKDWNYEEKKSYSKVN